MTRPRKPALFPAIRSPKQRAVLAAFTRSAQIGTACAQVGLSRHAHYYWLKHDAAYAAAFELAREMACDRLEDEATRRALGWDETQYTTGGMPYTVFRYSDILLIFLLKALKPETYREYTHLKVEGDMTLHLEERTRHANERLARLRRGDSSAFAS